MGWIGRGIKSGEGDVVHDRYEVFVHHIRVSGVCPQCGVPFNGITFTQENPDSAFTPANFVCPCGTFVYDPVYDSVLTKDTGETREELRQRYEATMSARGATR